MIKLDDKDIVLTINEKTEFVKDVEMLQKIFMQFGSDISSLFGEICNHYGLIEEIGKPEVERDLNKLKIYFSVVEILNNLNVSLLECDLMKKKVEGCDEEVIIIKSSEYENIRESLCTLLQNYTKILQFIYAHKVFTEEFINSIKERLAFLLNVNFENLRLKFKAFKENEV